MSKATFQAGIAAGIVSGMMVVSAKRPTWKTLFEGELVADDKYCEAEIYASEYGFNFGSPLYQSTLRLTVDGDSRLYPFLVDMVYMAGNIHLNLSQYEDDGFDMFIKSAISDLTTFVFRTPGAHQVKIEQLVQ